MGIERTREGAGVVSKDRKLYDEQCENLANHFLANCVVADPRSSAQVVSDLVSLAAAIQEAVDDWFAANPIEIAKGG